MIKVLSTAIQTNSLKSGSEFVIFGMARNCITLNNHLGRCTEGETFKYLPDQEM